VGANENSPTNSVVPDVSSMTREKYALKKYVKIFIKKYLKFCKLRSLRERSHIQRRYILTTIVPPHTNTCSPIKVTKAVTDLCIAKNLGGVWKKM